MNVEPILPPVKAQDEAIEIDSTEENVPEEDYADYKRRVKVPPGTRVRPKRKQVVTPKYTVSGSSSSDTDSEEISEEEKIEVEEEIDVEEEFSEGELKKGKVLMKGTKTSKKRIKKYPQLKQKRTPS